MRNPGGSRSRPGDYTGKDRLDRGDEAIHVVDLAQRHDHAQRLAAGIDAAAAAWRGPLELSVPRDSFLYPIAALPFSG